MATTSRPDIPRWLRFVLICDRAGSSWYIGTGFFFAPVLAILSPWPTLTAVLWVAIGLAGLWLGLLGVAMATGLAMALRSNAEIPEDYWRSIIDYPSTPDVSAASSGGAHAARAARCRFPPSDAASNSWGIVRSP